VSFSLALNIYIIIICNTDPNNLLSAHFSENWGYIYLSSIFSLNLLSFLFGRTLDAHAGKKPLNNLFPTPTTTTTTFLLDAHGPSRCLQGRDCYVDAIYLTIGTSLLSFFLSLWAGYRDSWKAGKLEMVEEDD
jgi:hypothetical protein